MKHINKYNESSSDTSKKEKTYTKSEVIEMLNDVSYESFIDGVKVGKSGGKVSSKNFTVSEWIEKNL